MKKNLKRCFAIGMAVCTMTTVGAFTVFAEPGAASSARPATTRERVAPDGEAPDRAAPPDGEASDRVAPPDGEAPEGEGGMGGQRGAMQELDLDSLVADGVIDQTTADKITAYMEAQAEARQTEMEAMNDMTESERQAYFESGKSTEKTDLLSQLVSAGIITQEEADAIEAAMPERTAKGAPEQATAAQTTSVDATDEETTTTLTTTTGTTTPDTTTKQTTTGRTEKGRGGMRAMDFSMFVTEGIIDQATADNMTAYMEAQDEARKTEMDAMKDMTESERQAYFESNKGTERTDMFAGMVSAGIITQDQADAMTAAMPERSDTGTTRESETGATRESETGRGFGGMHKMDLSTFVTEGIIDQTTADNITAYMEAQAEARKTEMEAMKDMTESERQAYFENNKGTERTDMFAELVSAGIITQDQADAMKAAMPEAPEMTEGGPAGGGHKMDFSSFVTEGIIDQATADSIAAYMEESFASSKDEGNKKEQRVGVFEQLVTEGIITQAQADAMKAAMPEPPARPEGGASDTTTDVA